MLRIAICDNDLDDLSRMKKMVTRYRDTMSLPIEVTEFESSKALADTLGEEQFDLYLLDIMMPDLDGISLGKMIRHRDEECRIVYTTSSREFAFDAWEIRAYHYLEKPVTEQELFRLLSEIINQHINREKENVNIRTKEGITSLNVNKVMYIENVSRRCIYHMANGNVIMGLCNRSSFEKEAEIVSQYEEFMQPHKSFFINMRYVKELVGEDFLLDNGEQVPISCKRLPDVKKEYLKFLAGGER